ncbi:MAG: hypothetical protein M3Y74_08540 [Chloroflexota bacterium]|nr:hypothetical protein [Chloroflexota bacterium]
MTEDGVMTYALPEGDSGNRAKGSAAPATQPAWGWGLALSGPRDDGDVAQALAGLPADARLYTARQQVSARRDLGARLGSYQEYRPEPFEETEH